MNNLKPPSQFPRLESERLLLRKITVEDVQDIFEYALIEEVTEFVPWYPHQTVQDSIEFIKFTDEKYLSDNWIVFGIELKENHKLIGTIDIRSWDGINNCADVGYVVSKNYWGKGIMTEALRRVIKFCFEELKLNRVEAHCEEENIGSWKVMEKCGMRHEGILREKVFMKNRYRSMKMYSLLRSEYSK